MPLRSSIIYLSLSLIFICGPLDARSAVWKPERMPGSARLALTEVDSVYLSLEPSADLVAALEDLAFCWPGELTRGELGAIPSKNSLVLIRDDRIEGFSFRRERTRVYLRASSDEGLTNGLYAICRELLGARWYWPGDLGFERVGEVAYKFPDRVWRERPAFVQRALSPVGADFARRNGLSRKYSFNHNLARIFTPEAYGTSPAVFAEIDGERQRPEGSAATDPQPDFTHPGAVDLAVAAARLHFQGNPSANSFSLSINDNSLFDEGAKTEAVVAPLEYFRRRPNYTDLVFGFMNQVAEDVFSDPAIQQTSDGEDRYITALAYYWTEQSPSFQLHPRVMPVLTSDRAQWHDPEYRAEDKALIRRWANSGAERIATWDYYFGAPYPYPRLFTQWSGESIHYLYESGVDVFYSQLRSIWGLDGPKPWLTADLLRDPEQKIDGLLDEFYTNFFGPAAEPMREFYVIAEQTRNEREGTASWIKFYKDEAGIELFPSETLARMRECIDLAMELAAEVPSLGVLSSGGQPNTGRLRASTPQFLDPARFSKRVQVVSEAFSYTESYANYHRCRTELVELAMAVLGGNADAVHGEDLVLALADYQRAKASFDELKEVLVENPMHQGLSSFNGLMQSEPLPLVFAALSRFDVELYHLELDKNASRFSRFRQLHLGGLSFAPAGKNPELKHSGTELRNFLGPELPVIDAWHINYRASESLRMVAASGQEDSGIRVENADIVSVAQTFPVLAERSYLLRMDASWLVSPDNRTRVQLNWQSITGENLQTDIVLRLPSGSSSGTQTLEFALVSPVNAYDLQLMIVTNRQYDGDYLEIERVELGQLVPVR